MNDLGTRRRVAVTGMAINTPLGDNLDALLDALLAGRSALGNWMGFDTSRIYARIGADLSQYDVSAKLASLEARLPPEMHHRVRKLIGRVAWSTRLSMLLAVEA